MKITYHYKSRLLPLLLALTFLTVALLFSMLSFGTSILVTLAGLLLGYPAGVAAWRNILRRIDRRNVAILFASDGLWYALLFFLYALSQAPVVLGGLPGHIEAYPEIAYGALLAILAMNTAYNGVLVWRFRRHEQDHGPLRVKEFHAPSVTGAVGMLGKSGTVVEPCSPRGRVKVEGELWNARSIEGQIAVGEKVIVRDLEGLVLVVEQQS